MKIIDAPQSLKSAFTTQIYTVPGSKFVPYQIHVGSTPPQAQNVLTLDMLPPTLRNVITQEDLDWFIFNIGNMIQSTGLAIRGLAEGPSAAGIGNWFRNLAATVVASVSSFTGDIIGNFVMFGTNTGTKLIANLVDFLKPIDQGGEGGGETLATAIANIFASTAAFVTNGLTSVVNNIFKGSSDVMNATFPLTVNIFVTNIIQQFPALLDQGLNVAKGLVLNAINITASTIVDWGRHFGGWSGEELNVGLPRIVNVEKQDIICKWLEWWLFDSDFGKWENEFNPLGLMSKESLYKSVCFSSTVDVSGSSVPLLPFGLFFLPHQTKSFQNGLWKLSWASRPKQNPSAKAWTPCRVEDGVIKCNI